MDDQLSVANGGACRVDRWYQQRNEQTLLQALCTALSYHQDPEPIMAARLVTAQSHLA